MSILNQHSILIGLKILFIFWLASVWFKQIHPDWGWLAWIPTVLYVLGFIVPGPLGWLILFVSMTLQIWMFWNDGNGFRKRGRSLLKGALTRVQQTAFKRDCERS